MLSCGIHVLSVDGVSKILCDQDSNLWSFLYCQINSAAEIENMKSMKSSRGHVC